MRVIDRCNSAIYLKQRYMPRTSVRPSDFTGMCSVLSSSPVSDGRGLAFECGDAVLLVFDPERTRIADAGVPTHGAIGEGHVAFAIDETEIDPWRRHLESCGVVIEAEVEWPEERGRSLYFRDPSGNVVELAPPNLWRRKLRENRGGAT